MVVTVGALGADEELMGLGGVKAEIVGGGPGADVGQLCRNGGGERGWDNEEHIVSIFNKDIASSRGEQVRSIGNESSGSNSRALDDTR